MQHCRPTPISTNQMSSSFACGKTTGSPPTCGFPLASNIQWTSRLTQMNYYTSENIIIQYIYNQIHSILINNRALTLFTAPSSRWSAWVLSTKSVLSAHCLMVMSSVFFFQLHGSDIMVMILSTEYDRQYKTGCFQASSICIVMWLCLQNCVFLTHLYLTATISFQWPHRSGRTMVNAVLSRHMKPAASYFLNATYAQSRGSYSICSFFLPKGNFWFIANPLLVFVMHNFFKMYLFRNYLRRHWMNRIHMRF